MSRLKQIFMDGLALIVLLAPAILLGWVGWSLLDWWAGIIGIILGLIIFAYSMNKVAAQEAADAENPAVENSNQIH